MSMTQHQIQSCIEACHACALTCDHCASSCLQEPNVQAMADCIMIDIDCAAICRLAASSMARGSRSAPLICAACADVCERCQDECTKYQMDHCKACAEACRDCAQACREMAAQCAPHESQDSNVAGLRQ